MYKAQNNKGRISLDSRSCKLLKIFAPFDTVVQLPMQLAAEDKIGFRLIQSNLGVPIQWYREVCNMCEVTNVKIQRLNRYPELWNGNEVPSEMFGDCFNIALYNSQSRNPQDQEEQKTLYINMFEMKKTDAEGHQALVFD